MYSCWSASKPPTGLKKHLFAFANIFVTFMTAGVIVGYSQLYPLMIDSGVYHDRCPKFTVKVCTNQTIELNSMFTAGASLSVFIQSVSGITLDFLGPKATGLIGLLMEIAGSLLFSFSSRTFEHYTLGFLLLSLGGPFVFTSSLHIGNLYPDNQGLIMMFLNGTYGGGALVFLVFYFLYRYFNLKILFIGYAVVLAALAVLVTLLWPCKKYDVSQKTVTEYTVVINEEAPPEIKSWKNTARTIKDQMLTLDYLFLVFFIPVMVLKSNFLLGTSLEQLTSLDPTNQNKVNLYNTVLGFMVPIVGLIAGPVGLIIDKWGHEVGVLFLLCLSSTSSFIGLVPQLDIQLIRFFLFSLYFPLVYGVWSALIGIKFGYSNYGVLFGTIAIGCGALNFLATPLDSLSAYYGTYFWVNLGLLVLSSVFVFYPITSILLNKPKRTSEDP
eukprot:TRINITY_DN3052_c0_g1_i1.p1 TRINITY_DN3052_c0_g1~~TRINITY_DN3052_c0_g1_i1.p1  ORF type:complete len:440 (+),score=58.88 TRINITY_DN3052_c0_g1_i1:94-1413(+)